MGCLSYLDSTIATDDLVTDETMTSPEMELTLHEFLLEYSSHFDSFSLLGRPECFQEW